MFGKSKVHFIGIGGSGMFPIVQILHAKGYYIQGSDNNPSDILDMVQDLGIKVFMGQKASNITNDVDLIVYSAAIMEDNPELIEAKASGILTVERSVMLGEITKQYENAICVCGTHGKTTATSMITQILFDAGVDPTAVIGGKLPAINGYGRVGKSDIIVCESCEFVNTFLELDPDITVILNIDEDHMDYFKTMDNLVDSFAKFSNMTSKKIFANGDDEHVLKAIKDVSVPVVTFGFGVHNDYYPLNIQYHDGIKTSFDLYHNTKLVKSIKLGEITLSVPGLHNVLNALAASVVCINRGATIAQLQNGLLAFKGASRRFEVVAEIPEKGITIVDDYAHHPAEIKVTLEGAKKLNFKRVIAVHQPFTYSRTKLHLDGFAKALDIADMTVLTEIMGSREKNVDGIYSKDLSDKIHNSVCYSSFEEVANHVASTAQSGDLIITMGCGDIYKVARMIAQKLK